MLTLNIKLLSMDDVKDFVAITQSLDYPVTLADDFKEINAKSIIGVFSLDLCHNLLLKLNTINDDTKLFDNFVYN